MAELDSTVCMAARVNLQGLSWATKINAAQLVDSPGDHNWWGEGGWGRLSTVC